MQPTQNYVVSQSIQSIKNIKITRLVDNIPMHHFAYFENYHLWAKILGVAGGKLNVANQNSNLSSSMREVGEQ